jgi:NAD(P)-dependent dehydrogenase (short-subunit alcohol dehydrogenase family)
MGRVVLVTGASSGIGEACAWRLARRGFEVFGGVRRQEDGRRLEEAAIRPLMLDITAPDQVAAAAEAVGDELHGLVNNAGVALAGPLELLPVDEVRRQLEVNVIGQIAVTQALLPALRRARGRIVLMGSIGGRSALPFLGPYAASKFALEAVADSLRLELRPFGVHVSIVEPGSIKTPIWTKGTARAEELRERFPDGAEELYGAAINRFRKVALARGLAGVDPDEVAKAVEHALIADRPRARYLVGRDARLRRRLERLPVRLRDRLLERALMR